jgi:primase-polymerase (primpol)-like protein
MLFMLQGCQRVTWPVAHSASSRGPPEVEDSHSPVRQCHRYIVQQRLKRPGAWWLAANADYMLALRLNRANRQWDAFGQQIPSWQHDQLATSI